MNTHARARALPDTRLALSSYDVHNDSWSEGFPMPTGRYGLAAARLGPYIYAVGGSAMIKDQTQCSVVVERYHTGLDKWDECPPLRTSRRYCALAAM